MPACLPALICVEFIDGKKFINWIIFFKGFYWDITDWATNTEYDDLNNHIRCGQRVTDKTKSLIAQDNVRPESLNSSNEFLNTILKKNNQVNFSPIYSKNYKGKIYF